MNASMTPKISIGMPVYNGEKYIREALDSIMEQTLTDFELIIADNASTDDTERICREYQDRDSKRIRYFRHVSNYGVMVNFQFVLNQVRGEYFMWAASDDRWDRHWLKQLLEKIVESHSGMAFGRVEHINESGERFASIANGAKFRFTGGTTLRRITYFLIYEGWGKACIMYGLYKKELIIELNNIFIDLVSGRCLYDYTLVYKLLKYASLENVDSVVLYKRVHTASAGQTMGFKNFGSAGFLRMISRILWPFPPKLIGEYIRYSSKCEMLILILLLPLKLLLAYRFKWSILLTKIGNALCLISQASGRYK
jgi:glycosyltransferase involved in cell wall biosynthesis